MTENKALWELWGSSFQTALSRFSRPRLRQAPLEGRFYLIDSKVEPQRGDVASLAVAAHVPQLQLEVVPTPVCNHHLIQAQAHGSGGAAGHREHQLTVRHLRERRRRRGNGMATPFGPCRENLAAAE